MYICSTVLKHKYAGIFLDPWIVSCETGWRVAEVDLRPIPRGDQAGAGDHNPILTGTVI
jgi:hypothetical protein